MVALQALQGIKQLQLELVNVIEVSFIPRIPVHRKFLERGFLASPLYFRRPPLSN